MSLKLTAAKHPQLDRLDDVERSGAANVKLLQEQFLSGGHSSDAMDEGTSCVPQGRVIPPAIQEHRLLDMPLPLSCRTDSLAGMSTPPLLSSSTLKQGQVHGQTFQSHAGTGRRRTDILRHRKICDYLWRSDWRLMRIDAVRRSRSLSAHFTRLLVKY